MIDWRRRTPWAARQTRSPYAITKITKNVFDVLVGSYLGRCGLGEQHPWPWEHFASSCVRASKFARLNLASPEGKYIMMKFTIDIEEFPSLSSTNLLSDSRATINVYQAIPIFSHQSTVASILWPVGIAYVLVPLPWRQRSPCNYFRVPAQCGLIRNNLMVMSSTPAPNI